MQARKTTKVAIGIGCAAVLIFVLSNAGSESPQDDYSSLIAAFRGSPITQGELPRGYEPAESDIKRFGGRSGPTFAFVVSLRGEAGGATLTLQVERSVSESENQMRQLRRVIPNESSISKLPSMYEAFCAEANRSFVECYAVIRNVVVKAESMQAKGSKFEPAITLLRAGAEHTERVLSS